MPAVRRFFVLGLVYGTTHAIHLAINKNFGDPSVITVDDKWYAFASGSNGARIPGATSPDIVDWTVTPNGALDQDYLASTPAWAYAPSSAIAAPDINRLPDGSYLMYFDATPSAVTTYRRCIGAATAASPTGPFKPQASPIVCGDNKYGWIDASGFVDDNGLRYLLYKLDGTNPGPSSAPNKPVPAVIYIQQVNANDGVTPIGVATPILQSVGGIADYGTVEAPSLIANPSSGGGYVLFYSSGFYMNSTYTVSYATSSSIMGPYTKQGALLQTGTYGLNAPGGADVIKNGSLMVFRANRGDEFDGMRYMWTGHVSYEGTKVSVS